MWVLTLDKNTR